MTPYVTNSDADLYFESRYDSALWDTTSETDKTKLLTSATRLLDALNYCGDKHDAEQENEFPRGDDEEVPQAIKDACCEIAYALLDGRNPEYEREMAGDNSLGTSGVRRGIDPDIVDVARVHNIPSSVAWNMIRPYLRDGSAITLVRVN
jgi:hypothetical protein